MKYVSFIFTVFLCVSLVLSLSSCGNKPTEPAETTSTTTATTVPTLAQLIEKDLSDMVTAEQLSAALGTPMSEPSVSSQGETLTSVGTEATVTLNVEVSEKPREIFDQVLLSYPIAVPCPNLGETAWYSSIYHHLLVYDQGYMVTVEVFGLDKDEEGEMLSCRQIAALLLEGLTDNATIAQTNAQ